MKKTLGVTNILTTRQHEKVLSNQKVCLGCDLSFLKFNEDDFFVFKNTYNVQKRLFLSELWYFFLFYVWWLPLKYISSN